MTAPIVVVLRSLAAIERSQDQPVVLRVEVTGPAIELTTRDAMIGLSAEDPPRGEYELVGSLSRVTTLRRIDPGRNRRMPTDGAGADAWGAFLLDLGTDVGVLNVFDRRLRIEMVEYLGDRAAVRIGNGERSLDTVIRFFDDEGMLRQGNLYDLALRFNGDPIE